MIKKTKLKQAPELEAGFEAWFARRLGPDADDEGARGDAARNLTMISLLFERAERLLDVPPGRVARALERLHRDDLHALQRAEIPRATRARCVAAVGDLFERYFARACRDQLGHLARRGDGGTEVETACYMFWDVLPLSARAGLTDDVIDVLERTLALRSLACQEAALHGLGHWRDEARERVEEVIDAYLARRGVPGALAEYARQARTGYVQ